MKQPERLPGLPVLAHTPTHLYIAPHPLLRPYIAHYTFCAQGPLPESRLPEQLTLIPDASGCVVFSCGGSDLSGCFWGPTTKTVVVLGDAEKIPLRFFIEFLPGGANRLLGLNLKDFTDRREPLESVHPCLDAGIRRAFEQLPETAHLTRTLDALLLESLAGFPGNPKPLPPILGQLSGLATVRAAAEKIGYSERHLQRLVTEALGMRYKTFTRLTRINLAMQRMEKDPVAFTRLAQSLGYYDQAHFNHDFKAVCGESPTKYYAHMSDFYNERYKF
ncbi:helix-turn-helix transcriptional regulator [Eubacterium sp. 1001713B170207_170306_E7]|uniref:helix-turn-helix domain-containing protein n=1 Tax=Eubacterium sp. 1001713B170207_170306_E7 TaxID=2787097 RepID=UPI0018996DB2|nr:helix-turn-helix transcriptional regulator [Eubacterium sp. 1001713B170207_170306_E7]